METDTLLIISIVGVWGNLILQSSWFVWSYKNHHRKHYMDDEHE